MNKTATFQFIAQRQRRWAQTRGLEVNSNGRVSRLEDNLFAPLHAETRAEFEAGDGDEFGAADAVGKIYSLHSSSALVCNIFDYWRGSSISPLVCGDIRFEQKFPTGVGNKPANLDVLFNRSDCLPTAVESKFTEPFQSGEHGLRPAYFRNSNVWKELPVCRSVAETLADTERFECLHAGQLLKHILGLTRALGKKRFTLLYLWYDVECSTAAQKHRTEVLEFGNLIADEVLFQSDTYQRFFERLCPLVSGTSYEAYLRSRYFSPL